MKGVRMTGLTDKSYKLVHALRTTELKHANGFRMIQVFSFCIGRLILLRKPGALDMLTSLTAFTPIFITPVACFAIYMAMSRTGSDNQPIDVATAFTSLSLVVILTQPLSSLFQYIPMFLGAANCLQRIHGFLQSTSHKDPRELISFSSEAMASSGTHGGKAVGMTEVLAENSMQPLTFAIRDGEFGWTKDARLLRDINISIPESQLTMIVGPVASGKTTLCKIFLGELSLRKGSVRLQARSADVAFCDQTPYLTNTTIRDSIIGFSPVDEAWYDTVIHASELETDLKSLEKRDQTMVGSNGDALSTGQRQRVAVARAVYSGKPVIIMDDVFSGMDNITRNRIFSRLLGPHGILRMRKATVILACHDQQPMLSPDHVITLRSNQPPVEETPKLSSRADTIGSDMQSPSTMHTSPRKDDLQTGEKREEQSPAAENKKSSPEASDWKTYKYFSSAVGVPDAFVLLALGAAFGVLYTFPSVWVNWWTADAGKDDFYLGIYALLQTAALACWFLFTRHSLTTVVSKSGSRLHDRLLSTVTSATMPYLSSRDAGSIINRFSQDLQMVDGELPAAMLNTIATAFIALAQVGLVATASPWLAVSYPFLLLVFFGVQKFYLQTSQQLRPLDLELRSPL